MLLGQPSCNCLHPQKNDHWILATLLQLSLWGCPTLSANFFRELEKPPEKLSLDIGNPLTIVSMGLSNSLC
jgi:hypothetical protein